MNKHPHATWRNSWDIIKHVWRHDNNYSSYYSSTALTSVTKVTIDFRLYCRQFQTRQLFFSSRHTGIIIRFNEWGKSRPIFKQSHREYALSAIRVVFLWVNARFCRELRLLFQAIYRPLNSDSDVIRGAWCLFISKNVSYYLCECRQCCGCVLSLMGT